MAGMQLVPHHNFRKISWQLTSVYLCSGLIFHSIYKYIYKYMYKYKKTPITILFILMTEHAKRNVSSKTLRL